MKTLFMASSRQRRQVVAVVGPHVSSRRMPADKTHRSNQVVSTTDALNETKHHILTLVSLGISRK